MIGRIINLLFAAGLPAISLYSGLFLQDIRLAMDILQLWALMLIVDRLPRKKTP